MRVKPTLAVVSLRVSNGLFVLEFEQYYTVAQSGLRGIGFQIGFAQNGFTKSDYDRAKKHCTKNTSTRKTGLRFVARPPEPRVLRRCALRALQEKVRAQNMQMIGMNRRVMPGAIHAATYLGGFAFGTNIAHHHHGRCCERKKTARGQRKTFPQSFSSPATRRVLSCRGARVCIMII